MNVVQLTMGKNKRIYAHYILYQGGIYKNTILEIGESNVQLFPFEQEIADTIFISGIVVVCDENISNIHQSSVLGILKSPLDLNIKSREMNRYLIEHKLYLPSDSRNMILYHNDGQLQRISL